MTTTPTTFPANHPLPPMHCWSSLHTAAHLAAALTGWDVHVDGYGATYFFPHGTPLRQTGHNHTSVPEAYLRADGTVR